MAEQKNKGPSSMGKLLVLAVLVAALVGGVSGLGAAYLARPNTVSQAREFFLFPNELPFNNTVAGIPHYVFIPDQIVVNKGDKITIHYYDTTDEDHTFTMDAPYGTDAVVAAATSTAIQKKDISLVAGVSGVFPYHCRFHSPTMTGTLVVLG